MEIRTGDMWRVYDTADLFLVSSNGYVRNNRLAMDSMMSASVYHRFKHHRIDEVLGLAVVQKGTQAKNGSYYWYGLLLSDRWPAAKLGLLQSRHHYAHPTTHSQLADSIQQLRQWATDHPNARIHMNWPGVGVGGLAHYETLPLLETLPDNVVIWTLDPWWTRQPHSKQHLTPEQIASMTALFGDPDDFFYGSGTRNDPECIPKENPHDNEVAGGCSQRVTR